MKCISKISFVAFFCIISFHIDAQVGIGTNSPEGMLDLQNNEFKGFVFPKAALTASNSASPVTNPDGGPLVQGTVIFNTNTTQTGSNDVSPGIYAWDGTKWNPQYLREDSALYEQSPLDFRTVTGDETYNSGTSDWAEIPGLETGSSFTAKYTGKYRIKTSFNFGAGKMILPVTGSINMGTMEGLFRFTFNGSSDIIYTHSYSLYNGGIGSGTYYEQYKHDTSIVKYVDLVAGQVYPFKLEIDIFVGTHFEDTGNSGDGRGHVGVGTPCTVEFTFLD